MPLPLCKFVVIPRRLIKLSSLIGFYFLKLLDCFLSGLVWNGKVQFSLGIESILGF